MLYLELNTVGGYPSPACGGGKITSTQFFLIDKGILSHITLSFPDRLYVFIGKLLPKSKQTGIAADDLSVITFMYFSSVEPQ